MTAEATAPTRAQGEYGGAPLVPAYFHPQAAPEAWRKLVALPPRLVVVDIGGTSRDADYAPLVTRLLASGVEVLGRVDTDFGLRPVADVRADLRRYRSWYGMRGVYLDRVAADPGRLDHYREIVDGIRGTIALNPGVYPDPGYAHLADLLVTFEGPLSAHAALREPEWARDQARGRFCQLVHGVPGSARHDTLRRAAELAGTVAVTDRVGATPWGDLPAYYGRPIVTG